MGNNVVNSIMLASAILQSFIILFMYEMFCTCAGSLQGVGVIGQTSVLYTGVAQHFSWKNFGFKLGLPSNALPPDVAECQINIEAIGGQFEFPEDSEPISGIYSISSPCTLQKPAVVEIQHCAVVKTVEQCSRLSFVVARSSGLQEALHSFSVEDGGIFGLNSPYGRIQITQFSLWSMVCNLLPGLSVQRVYSAALYYIHDGINSWKVHFVITWDLDIHIKVGLRETSKLSLISEIYNAFHTDYGLLCIFNVCVCLNLMVEAFY